MKTFLAACSIVRTRCGYALWSQAFKCVRRVAVFHQLRPPRRAEYIGGGTPPKQLFEWNA